MNEASWFGTFFYIIAWGAYLFLLEYSLRRDRKSLLFSRPGTYLRMALFSVPVWLSYEAVNVRLGNWEYWDLPESRALRWAGYTLAYATVLPAVVGTAEWIKLRLPDKPAALRPSLTNAAASIVSYNLGALCLGLPMIWPTLFFPLIWAPAFLFLEPGLVRRAPGRSWLSRLSQGKPRDFYALLLSGIVCGLLWELLNFWAGAKWKYTVPWPSEPKLFEMPLLGFLGFPPFALGCASLWHGFDEKWKSAGTVLRLSAALGLALFSLAVFSAIDVYTVKKFVSLW